MLILNQLRDLIERLTGVSGSLEYLVFAFIIVLVFNYVSNAMFPQSTEQPAKEIEEEEPDPPRNFTSKQLRYFNGQPDEKTGENKPVYLSINGTVFDVSEGKGFYGPGGPYELFAGRECGVALAKMSFNEEFLDDIDGCQKLNFGERTDLEGWIDKFTYYKCYPIKGRLIPDSKLPDPNRILTLEDLAKNGNSVEAAKQETQPPDASGQNVDATTTERSDSSKQDSDGSKNPNQTSPPEGYAVSPIYIGAGDKVFDMSFGGVTFYGPGGPYSKFAGRNASRALAKMSLDVADLDNTDISDCTEKQLKTLNDWITTFEERKGYPIVGRLKK